MQPMTKYEQAAYRAARDVEGHMVGQSGRIDIGVISSLSQLLYALGQRVKTAVWKVVIAEIDEYIYRVTQCDSWKNFTAEEVLAKLRATLYSKLRESIDPDEESGILLPELKKKAP